MTTRRRRSAERVTLSDVARSAGCSLMSASRALSQPELVSDALRERVEQAVKALGYVPHPAARSLASSRSNLVAVIIPSLSNAVFVDTVEAIQRVLMPAGYEMMIGVSHYRPEEDERLLRAYLAHQPAGLLLTGFERSEAARAVLASYTAPRVTLMELSDQADSYCVGFSQLQAGAAMTRTLLERGYRHVAFAAAQLDPRTLQRAEGYRQAMREAGRYEPTLELLTP
ncbi:LacI family DNA-binding transcriptional regulator, partial [Stutzerimonas kunmingensis]|uniref:LacI family DNA-binding transcriptional regulator n=1 Tax=Stutzerimonas kunmingensis TaxID=1211807 RepID=UPI0028A1330E